MATYTENYSLTKPSYGELADVAVLNQNMDTVDGLIHSNRTMLAPAFSQTENYAKDDIVEREGNLYRFIVDHAAGNWDATEVEQTTLGEELSNKGGADVTKTASGNPIEITDGADAPLVKCVTAIQGNQDLHGYDKPWVGGAGKNLVDESTLDMRDVTGTSTYRAGLAPVELAPGDYTISYSSKSSSIELYITIPDDNYSFSQITQSPFTFTLSATKNVMICSSAGSVNLWDVVDLMLEAGTVATSYEPYSNICPITAYSSGDVVRRGHNVWNEDWETGDISAADGQNERNPNLIRTVDYIDVSDTTSYRFIITSNPIGNIRARFYDANKNYLGYLPQSGITITANTVFTPPTNAHYMRFAMPSDYGNTYKDDISVSTPSSFTDYEPYVGTTHTTTYPSAIYRGSEDVVNGTVTTEWGMIASYAGETLSGEWISDRDEYAPGTTPTTGAQVAYELATPTTSSVTPTNLPIKSLSGYTHIESSTGDMEVEYITEDFQPIVDLIEDASGVTYSETEHKIGKWVDGSDLYERTYTRDIVSPGSTYTEDIDVSGLNIMKITKHYAHYLYSNIWYYLVGDSLNDTNSQYLHLQYKSEGLGILALSSNIGAVSEIKLAFTIRYTKQSQTRSLNLSKSAVEEIPDEIKNAEYEEKPDYNEAEDDAPTEEKR